MVAFLAVGFIIYFASILVASYCIVVSSVLCKWMNLLAQNTKVVDVYCQKADLICQRDLCCVQKG